MIRKHHVTTFLLNDTINNVIFYIWSSPIDMTEPSNPLPLIPIHPPRPINDTIRFAISKLGYRSGISALSTFQVPYAIVNNGIIVTQVLRLFEAIFGPSASLRIMEHGAGMGIFAKLMKTIPSTLTIDYTICDAFSPSLDALRASDTTPPQFNYLLHDVMSDLPIPCDVQVLSYVLDGIPTRFFKHAKGELYECLIDTAIPESATLIDNRTFPPTPINAPQLVQILQRAMHHHDEADTLIPMLGALSSVYHETMTQIPLADSTVEDEIKSILHTLCQRYPYLACISISKPLIDTLRRLMTPQTEPQLILIHDVGSFGKSSEAMPPSPYSNYGPLTYFPLTCELIIMIAQDQGFDYLVDSQDKKSRFLLLFKGYDGPTMFKAFYDHMMPSQAIAGNPALLASCELSHTELWRWWHNVEPMNRHWIHHHVFVAQSLAYRFLEMEKPDLALAVVAPFESEYGGTVMSLQILRMAIFARLNQFDQVIRVYEQSDSSIQFSRRANLLRCQALIQLNQEDLLLDAIPQVFTSQDPTNTFPWSLLETFFDIQRKKGMELKHYRDWLESSARHIMPAEQLEALGNILKEAS